MPIKGCICRQLGVLLLIYDTIRAVQERNPPGSIKREIFYES